METVEYLDVCFCPEQNDRGTITPATSVRTRSLSNTTFFSDRINCRIDSDAREKINDFRENAFKPTLDHFNEHIVDGTKPYTLERTKTIGTPEYGKLCHVMRLVFDVSKASPEDFIPEKNDSYENIPLFSKLPVKDVIDLGVRRATFGKNNPDSWPKVNWGELRPKRKKINKTKPLGTMGDIWPKNRKTGTDD
jgi:hypothetical protein